MGDYPIARHLIGGSADNALPGCRFTSKLTLWMEALRPVTKAVINTGRKRWPRRGSLPEASDARLDSLYRAHFNELCANIRKSFGPGPPESEDAVQSAFMKFASLENPEKIKDARAYLYIMARNVILDHKRTVKVANAYIAEQIALDHALKLEGITPERVVVSKQRFSTLVEAMRTLPRKQQAILVMSRIEGKSYREIRKETGWSAGDISRNMTAGISALVIALKRAQKIEEATKPQVNKDGNEPVKT